MATAKKIWWNWVSGVIQIASDNATPVPAGFWNFYKYQKIPFEIGIVEPAHPWGPNDFAIVDITAMALKVSASSTLNNATPEAEQTNWTKDTDRGVFVGSLDLNTSTMNSYVGDTDGKNVYFQIQATEPHQVSQYRRTVQIYQSATQPTTTSPDPLKVYPTLDEVLGMCVPRILAPGETITWQDGEGNDLRVIGVRTDGTHQDDSY